MTTCPLCEAALESPLCCTSCKALLEVSTEPTPFEALGLELRWDLDKKQLQQSLLRFTRLMHPDFFAAAEPEERERAERGSALLNEAFEVLSDDIARASWLVEARGGPSESEERQMPQAFLMEVLEWNETLEEARESAAGSDERAALPAFAQNLKNERAELLEAMGRKLTPLPEEGAPALAEVRRDLNAVRYLDRALTELESLRLESAAR